MQLNILNTHSLRIFHTENLMIYIDNYITETKAKYLPELAEPLHEASPLSKSAKLKTDDKEIRSSMSAVVLGDTVVACVERRSVEFKGTCHLVTWRILSYQVRHK